MAVEREQVSSPLPQVMISRQQWPSDEPRTTPAKGWSPRTTPAKGRPRLRRSEMKKQLTVMLLCLFVSPVATAGVPAFVTYSGRLTDGTGWGESTETTLVFYLYDSADAIESFWHTTHENVPVVDGYFTVNLGMCNEDGSECTVNPADATFPAELPCQMWIGVVVGGVELARQPVGSVPYAMTARTADANGVPVGMVGVFRSACPVGWDRVEELDGFSIRGGDTWGLVKSDDSGSGATSSIQTTNNQQNDATYVYGTEDGTWKNCSGRTVMGVCGPNVKCINHKHTVPSTSVNATVVPKHYSVVFCEFKGCFGGGAGNASNCD